MSQQATDLQVAIKDILFDNWALEDKLEKNKITWFSYKPTTKQFREEKITIAVSFESGTGNPTSKAVSQMQDTHKIDVYMPLPSLEGDTERVQAEANRMTIKDQILKIIHDNQTGISGVKFGKYTRSARNDEVESSEDSWFLHEILFIQAEWYHTES